MTCRRNASKEVQHFKLFVFYCVIRKCSSLTFSKSRLNIAILSASKTPSAIWHALTKHRRRCTCREYLGSHYEQTTPKCRSLYIAIRQCIIYYRLVLLSEPNDEPGLDVVVRSSVLERFADVVCEAGLADISPFANSTMSR